MAIPSSIYNKENDWIPRNVRMFRDKPQGLLKYTINIRQGFAVRGFRKAPRSYDRVNLLLGSFLAIRIKNHCQEENRQCRPCLIANVDHIVDLLIQGPYRLCSGSIHSSCRSLDIQDIA